MPDLNEVCLKPLKNVRLSSDGERISFNFVDGTHIRYGVAGDCCSRSWIEHLTLPTFRNSWFVITSVTESDEVPWDGHTCGQCDHDHLQVYNIHFHTSEGDIILEFRNDSNGYYGGYLVQY